MRTRSIVIGVAAVGISGMVGFTLWAANQKLKLDDPKLLQRFKVSFERSCVDKAVKRVEAAGTVVTDEMGQKLIAVCGCMADEMGMRLAKDGGLGLMDITPISTEFRAHMQEATAACTAKLGLQGN